MEGKHIHAGFMIGMIGFLSLIPAFTLWRIASAHMLVKNENYGKAMAFIF
jgi:hypothetical protein